ncbi:MAG: class I SAM-dependent methyltransferase [Candidatus Woesearchaeota archaeon]
MKSGWSLSASFYDEISYSKLMHDIDGYTNGFLAGSGKLKDSIVLDFGAGTGNMGFKLVEAGAKKVIAIENDPIMLKILHSKRKKKEKYQERIDVIEKSMYDGIFDDIKNQRFDVQLFRRCLYGTEENVRHLLSESFNNLNENGIMFIVHPEADSTKYFSDGFGGIAISHVLKWYISNLGKMLGMEYNRYTQNQLEIICKESCPDSQIDNYPAIRPAYNILTISKR